MKEEALPDDFVSSLLMQDELLRSEKFDPHRRELLARLKEAAQRERKARKGVLAAGVLGALFILAIFGVARLPASQAWSEPLVFAVAIAVILTPVTILILFGIYLFRYRASLQRARKDARQQTLLEVPRQLEELRKEIEELRKQLPKSAFTLTEMVVSIGVLTILSSLLLPAVSGAKARARNINCASNLRQLAQGVAMYEGDYHLLPGSGDPVIGFNHAPWVIRDSNAWTVKIGYYLSNENVFLCPSYRAFYDRYRNLSQDSFGYNAGGGARLNDRSSQLGLGYGSSNFVNIATVVSPAEMISLGDLQTTRSLWLNYISPDQKHSLGNYDSLIPTRHSGGANMTFVDGHVQWAKRLHWLGLNVTARARWNIDHQPHRETW
jgi:prepilin-type processing-associated H-X9-DG protein